MQFEGEIEHTKQFSTQLTHLLDISSWFYSQDVHRSVAPAHDLQLELQAKHVFPIRFKGGSQDVHKFVAPPHVLQGVSQY